MFVCLFDSFYVSFSVSLFLCYFTSFCNLSFFFSFLFFFFLLCLLACLLLSFFLYEKVSYVISLHMHTPRVQCHTAQQEQEETEKYFFSILVSNQTKWKVKKGLWSHIFDVIFSFFSHYTYTTCHAPPSTYIHTLSLSLTRAHTHTHTHERVRTDSHFLELKFV